MMDSDKYIRTRLVAKDGFILEQRKKLWFLIDPKGKEIGKAMGMREATIASFLRIQGGKAYQSERHHWCVIVWADDGSCLKQSKVTRRWHVFDRLGELVAGRLRREDALLVAFHQTWKHV